MSRKAIRQTILLLAGAVVLGLLVWKAGPADIARYLSRIGWGFLALLCLALLWNTIAALAWRLLFDREHPSIGWKVLWRVRIYGEGVNTLTPFLNLGGEPLKIWMLKRRLDQDKGTTYVVLDKTIYFLASLLYMASGLLVGIFVFTGHLLLLGTAAALLGLWVAGIVYLIRRQSSGSTVTAVLNLLEKVRIHVKPELRNRMEQVDADLATFWKNHKIRFIASLLTNFLGRAVRALDVWVIAWMLKSPMDIWSAYFISAAAIVINATFAFIPGALGAYEGGHGYLFHALGLSGDAGISMGIIRRIRTLAFAGLSYVLMVLWPLDGEQPENKNAPKVQGPGSAGPIAAIALLALAASLLATKPVFAETSAAEIAAGKSNAGQLLAQNESGEIDQEPVANGNSGENGDENGEALPEEEGPEVEEVVLTLPETVERALARSVQLDIMRAGIGISEGQLLQAKRARWAPHITLTEIFTGINRARGDATFSPDKDTDFLAGLGIFNKLDIEVAQPLYTFGKLSAGADAARNGVEVARNKAVIAEAEVREQVKKLYWGIITTEDVGEILRSVRKNLDKFHKQIKDKLEADTGEMTNIDLYEMEVLLARFDAQAQENEDWNRKVKRIMALFLGLEPNQSFRPADRHLSPPSEEIKDIGYYLDNALTSHPLIQTAKAGVRAREAQVRLAEAKRYPDIFIGAKFGWAVAPNRTNQSNAFVNDPYNGYGGGPFLGLRWDLALHRTNAEVATARAQLMETEAQARGAEFKIRTDVESAYVQTLGAQKTYNALKKALKSAKKLFRATTLNFSIGVAKVDTIKRSYQDYVELRGKYLKSLYDYNDAYAELRKSAGLPPIMDAPAASDSDDSEENP